MTSEKAAATVTVLTKVSIEEQRISDMLCNAFEGGSTYWAISTRIIRSAPANSNASWASDIPIAGGQVRVGIDPELIEDAQLRKIPLLTRASCLKGLQIMANKFPRCFADLLAENDDAGTADVFLQCCLFGDVIFS